MKPEEAIEVLSNELIVITDMIGYCKDFEKESDLALAYRVKRQEAHNAAISAIKEIQQYRKIGTVEECREAREKQRPKAPIMKPYYDDMPDEEYLCCPTCGDILTDRIPADNKNFYFHCLNCGQKFDWSDDTNE